MKKHASLVFLPRQNRRPGLSGHKASLRSFIGRPRKPQIVAQIHRRAGQAFAAIQMLRIVIKQQIVNHPIEKIHRFQPVHPPLGGNGAGAHSGGRKLGNRGQMRAALIIAGVLSF